MMYQSKLAVALKSAGKVLREFGDEVYVPFGSEYSIYIKNMNSVRALVTVTVDGTDVGDGTSFVVDANSSIDIERFIKNGNLDEGNRLKFIERTGAIEDHRGIGIEDGLVRVEFQFERKPLVVDWDPHKYVKGGPYNPDPWIKRSYGTGDSPHWTLNNTIGSTNVVSAEYSAQSANVMRGGGTSTSAVPISAPIENENGITVPGSRSEQTFKHASWFPVEAEKHVIVLKLLGETADNKQVRKPVTVKTKPRCTTCGKQNKATAKFCTECGTALQII